MIKGFSADNDWDEHNENEDDYDDWMATYVEPGHISPIIDGKLYLSDRIAR